MYQHPLLNLASFKVENHGAATNWVRELTVISAIMFIGYSASSECHHSVSNPHLYTRQTDKM
jgi:hypothetical protein